MINQTSGNGIERAGSGTYLSPGFEFDGNLISKVDCTPSKSLDLKKKSKMGTEES